MSHNNRIRWTAGQGAELAQVLRYLLWASMHSRSSPRHRTSSTKSFTGEKVIRNFGFRARLALGVKRIRLRLRLTPHSVQTPTEPLLDVRFFWEHPERADSL